MVSDLLRDTGMERICAIAVALLAFSAWAWADQDVSVEELAKRNQELEDRVKKLEAQSLEEDILTYLQESESAAAEGAGSVVTAPGAMAMRWSGEVRLRFEVRDHIYSPADPDATQSFNITRMRTRLRTDVDLTKVTSLVIEIQDVRRWGDEQTTVGILGNVDIKRAYMYFKNINGGQTSVQAGRFVMFYGDQRVIGHLEWVDQGRSYDGFRVLVDKKETSGFWVDFFGVQIRETNATNEDQWLTGAYGGWKWIEAYVLGLIDQRPMAGEAGTGKTRFATIGFRIARKSGNWDYSVEVPFQFGKSKGDDLTAWAAALVVGHTWKDVSWKPRLGFEFSYGSGDQDATDGKSEQFQTMFPTNHLFYGWMDLLDWSNIYDFRFRFRMQPSQTVTISIDYHHFRRPEAQGNWVNAAGRASPMGGVIRLGAPGTSSHLGDEIDIAFNWNPTEPVTIQIGYAIFLPGDFVKETGADPISHFFWIQARVRF